MSRKFSLHVCFAIGVCLAAVAPAEAGKSIALILDASGSMNARLPEGRTRIEAAKAAVEEIVGKLAADVRISLRAYGHQSPTSKHDCLDTELMVGFDGLAANKDSILAKSRSIKAQGYTPITYVIKLAAEDVGKEDSKPRIVILVSDGKETCKGDPCATAKALADADASLVIHTIGFAVDTAAKYQLQCIARVARGNYFDADSAGKLAAALGEAAKTEAAPPPPPPRTTTQITVVLPKPGRLAMKNANIMGHAVTEAETGKAVGSLSPVSSSIELPAGFYNVALGSAVWKSIEVKPGETTTIEPAVLEIKHASISGHKVLDNETGEEIASVVSSNPRITVLPSTFAVTFGAAVWKDIEVKAGEHKILNPGTITVNGAPITGVPIKDSEGNTVASVSPLGKWAPLPPGKYTVEIGNQKVPVELAEGQDIAIDAK
ncbi:MAG TPA: VWA domain-containing protein [Pseudolabrys sp.]|nr:VWA domain-containing protein [Pseudolabrys sp.]